MRDRRSGFLLRMLFSMALMGALLFGAVGRASAATVMYVKWDAAGANNGTSWTDAYRSLQTALSHARAGSGIQIWVARGTYKPSLVTVSSDQRSKTFKLKNGVSLYGGFVGTETLLTQRNVDVNRTILSGDIGVVGSAADNAYHVVTSVGTNSTAVLDGFIIRAGVANGLGNASVGGGIFNYSGSPALKALTITANSAVSGGGMWNDSGSPTFGKVLFLGNHAGQGAGMFNYGFLSNPVLDAVTFQANVASNYGGGFVGDGAAATMAYVDFIRNTATNYGGGMWAIDIGISPLTNVTFDGNSAGAGGGLYVAESGPVLKNVTFKANTASSLGGAVYNTSTSGSPKFINVTFSGNTASLNSGGMYNTGNSPLLNNTTFTANAGAMYNISSTPAIWNSIFFDDGGTEFVNFSSFLTITDSIVEGADPAVDCLSDLQSSCTHVLDSDPMLGPLSTNGGPTLTRALGPGSPAIDAGGFSTGSVCASKDQRGVTRPQGLACDMGAYEVRAMSFISQAAYDGWVLESRRGSHVGGLVNAGGVALRLGDDALNRQYRGFLSFNTAPLPDAVTVIMARLRLKSTGVIAGVSPFTTHGPLLIDLKKPFFGVEVALVSSDFQAGATITPAGSVGPTLTSGYYTGFLNSGGRTNINRTGLTQLRLRFGTPSDLDSIADFVSVYTSNSGTASDRPRLIVYFNP